MRSGLRGIPASPVAVPCAALVVLALACREAPTDPWRPAGPAPDGLAATLVVLQSFVETTPSPTIAVVGDSLVATARLETSGCADYTAQAGAEGAAIVVTLRERFTDRACLLVTRPADFRVAVRPPAGGRRLTVLRHRLEIANPGVRERELVRRTVTLP